MPTINFADDEFYAVYDVVKAFVHADDEYISNHDPIRIGLLKLMKAMPSDDIRVD